MPLDAILTMYGSPDLLELCVQLVHHHPEEYEEYSCQDRSYGDNSHHNIPLIIQEQEIAGAVLTQYSTG